MAASNAAIISRMRAAGVPPHAFTQSLATLKQARFSKILVNKEFDLGEGGLVSYIVRPSTRKSAPNVAMVCSVAAKELVLLGRQVFYVTLPEIAAKVSLNWWETEWRGYVVVGDLGENTKNWPPHVWDTVQSMLLSHISRGGAVVVGDSGVVDDGMLNFDMINALSIFEEITVE